MKIAVPVNDETLTIYANAAHAPYFAVFSLKGEGMFKSYALEELRANPRTDDHNHDCGGEHGHACPHKEGEVSHDEQHDSVAQAIADCTYIVVKKACKNTMMGMSRAGLKVVKYGGIADKAPVALAQMGGALV